ncbi:MAG: preprotein translocase subunit SecG [Halieaceae bacterium]|jgi:preprotein translocase subunit SecG
MEQLVLVGHLIVALAIIGLIMLQQGKGADMGASFGAGSSQTLFGSSGSGNALTRATTILVVLFFCSSLGLAILAKSRSEAAGQINIPIPEMTVSEPLAGPSDIPVLDDIPGGDEFPSRDDVPELNDIPTTE